jgi:hypothetical protein
MKFKINNIGKTLIGISIDEIQSGTLNQEEAKELALHLLDVVRELLEVEEKKCPL